MEKKRLAWIAIPVTLISFLLFLELAKSENLFDTGMKSTIKYFKNEREKAIAKGCSANMSMIEGAKKVWEIDTGASEDATPTWSDLIPKYLRREPRCLSEGVYTIGDLKTPPMCSVHGDKKNIEKALSK